MANHEPEVRDRQATPVGRGLTAAIGESGGNISKSRVESQLLVPEMR